MRDTREPAHHVARCAAAVPPLVVLGRHGKVVLNSGESVAIRYALVEAEWLVTSHRGLTYEADPRYPSAAQPRDYGAERELQIAVEGRSSALDPWQLLSNSVLSVDGPPIARNDGVVISGNGRTQSIRLAASRGLYGEVLEEIAERLPWFQIDPETIPRMATPVLVRVLQDDVRDGAQLARYGVEMNRDPGQGMSATEQSAGMARLMTESVVRSFVALMGELPDGCSVREFMRVKSRDIAELLSVSGLVDARKRAEYFKDNGDLAEAAKDLFEVTLAGLSLRNDSASGIDAIRHASHATREKLVRGGVQLMRVRSAGESWDLSRFNEAAVRLVTTAENRSAYLRTLRPGQLGTRDSLVDRMLHPDRYENAVCDLGMDPFCVVHPAIEALARALELTPRDYVACLTSYAETASGNWDSMFACLPPADVFSRTVGIGNVNGGVPRWSIAVSEAEWAGECEPSTSR